MSKLGAGVQGTDRSDLEALVGMGDTSVPGIEMSDLNDGDILARTRENVNPNGLFQFVYIPDDGSDPITSDWVDQEHKKKLTRNWVDGVKQAIIGRAQAGLEAAREKQLEERARRIKEEQMADAGDITPVAPAAVQQVVRGQQPPIVLQVHRSPALEPSDPSAYVEDQLDAARERLKAAEIMQQNVMREVITARRDYEKWKALASALSGVGDSDTGSSLVQSQPQLGTNADTARNPATVRAGRLVLQGR